MDRNVVLYIDEEQTALESYGRVLRQQLPRDLEVVCRTPEPTIGKMVSLICGMRARVASIILDQHLEAAGTADYIGSELADAYRQLDNKIPIYILSNHPDDVDDNHQSIEYVLSKDDFSDGGEALKSATKRIVRHINTYGEILSENEQRFVDLLRRHVAAEITEAESAELEELKFWREVPVALEESALTLDLKKQLDEQELELQRIENLLGKGD